MDLIQSMWFPSFWEFKRRFFSRVLKVPNDIVKSEFMLEPGIITSGLLDCNAVDEIGGSSRVPMHVFHKMHQYMQTFDLVDQLTW